MAAASPPPASRKQRLHAALIGMAVFAFTWAIHWSDWFTVAELKSLDHRFRLYADPARAHPALVLVAIDEDSLRAFGRWPWPRDRHGYLVDFLRQAGAKAIAFDVLFSEPDENAEEFDDVFAESVRRAGNVFLPLLMHDEQSDSDQPSQARPPATALLPLEAPRPAPAVRLSGDVQLPIPSLAQAARGLGSINLFTDEDGTTRRLPLAIATPHGAVQHLATGVARYVLGVEHAVASPGQFRLGPATIPLTDRGEMLLNWHGDFSQRVYRAYSSGAVLRSYTDLRQGRRPFLDPSIFKDKIVFVGATAAGTYDLRNTPLSPITPGVLVHMTAVDNILQRQHLRIAPHWATITILFVLCMLTAWAFILIHNQTVKLVVILALAGTYYAAAAYVFTAHALWLDLVIPEGAMALTFATAATVEYLTEGKQRRLLRAAFDKYMAPDVVDEIMRDPHGIKLGGEKKELTVLFSDVAGFTTISEKLDPEQLVELLNEYLSAMTDIILQHRGNVNKYLGDGIMAIFGAPRGDPAHGTQACLAALACQETLDRLRTEWRARGLPDVSARIGINSGPLIVGNMGSPTRMEYTVMGDTVNLASRLEGAGKYYDARILIGPRTRELTIADVESREVDLLRVKGKHVPVVVYELMGRKGELPPVRQAVLKPYCNGLIAYKQRAFDRAERLFAEALALDPQDGPSKIYLERARRFLLSPPPADWDGVYELKSK